MSDKATASDTSTAASVADVLTEATQVRVLRFTVGVGLAVFLAAWLEWDLAHIAPVLTAKFLVDKPALHRETVIELLLAMLVTIGLGMLLSGGITQYPIPLMMLIGLMMMWGYYLFTNPKWNLFATILILAILVLPFIAITSATASGFLAGGLTMSGVVAITLFALAHIYFPEPEAEFPGFAPVMLTPHQRWRAAFRALLISFPVVCFFFVFQISEAILTMIFIALLSLMITGEKSVKLSAFLVVSNGLGGLLAIGSFTVLAIVPNIGFYTLFTALLAMVMATKIYTAGEKAPVYVTAFSTLLVLIGSTLLSSGDIDSTTITRIVQLVVVGLYMIVAAYFLETRTWKFLQPN
ncbi:DUF2955 domain-containing protein [Photobacterium atrarenae]|uniref:DUF2955 domain-containing protein n=1 Tax=Photobacterium atrarenae TaxID=865757 RepID=UPI003F6F2311